MHKITLAPIEINPATHGSEIGNVAESEGGFDAAAFPILAEHWFGWRPVGDVAAEVVQDLAFRRKVTQLVAKGERAVGEMLAEIAADRNLGTVIDQLLNRYIDIDDAALDATNGRNFPPPPLHEAGDG